MKYTFVKQHKPYQILKMKTCGFLYLFLVVSVHELIVSVFLTINVLHMLLISLFGIVLYFVSSLPSILKSSKVDAIISMKKIG